MAGITISSGITASAFAQTLLDDASAQAMAITLGVPCKLAEVSLSGNQASLDFTSIPATFKHLQFIGLLRDDRSGAADDSVKVAFNNDTTDANYDRRIDVVSAAFVANDRNGAAATGATATADQFTQNTIWIAGYAGATRKTFLNEITDPRTADTTMPIQLRSLLWQSTAAISRVTFTPNTGTNFVAGTILSLYGWP